MAIYVLTAVLVGLLGVATFFALVIGLMGLAGFLRLARCQACGHLTVTAGRIAQSCPQCRHEHLAHPLASLHHLHVRGLLPHH